MHVIDVLASSPLLTVFTVVALGTGLGAIKFGPLRFGAAGALFVGLAFGALDPRLGEGLELLQTLGLALFVYTVGLAAGGTFFRDLRSQAPLMGVGVVALVIVAGLAAAAGALGGLSAALVAGVYAGALTSTPALAAAADAAGSQEPAIGYALAYPVGVIVAIVVIALVVERQWPAGRDRPSFAASGLDAASVLVDVETRIDDVPGFAEQEVRMSYLARQGRVRVIDPEEKLLPGDRVVVVGPEPAVERAIENLGTRLAEHLADDRTVVDVARFVVSNRDVVGRTVAELDLPGSHDGVVTRVRRGDVDLLARDDLMLEYGDRVLAVVPRERLEDARALFGDSERKISEIDAFTVGIGMAIGLAVGLVAIPLPGGASFALGSAAGPLLVGMVLGRLERTGPVVWGMPQAANLTTRQLGLLFFLAAVGLASGQAFAEEAFTRTGLLAGGLAVLIVLVSAVLMIGGGRLLGLSAQRTAGAFAGYIGQPAILAFAGSKVVDERIESGYAALFALGILAKLVMVQVIVAI